MLARTRRALARRVLPQLWLRARRRPDWYWEARAADLIWTYDHPETWAEKSWLRADVEEVTIPALLRGADVRSVVVAGAGCGREYVYLQRHGFDLWGFDISPTMAAEARARFPSIPTAVASVVGAHRTQPQADAVVSSAVLTHVPPDDIAAAVASVKQLARRIVILREKTIFIGESGYQWQHDYDALFAPWRCTHRETTDERPNERVELMAWERPQQSRDVLRNDAD